jgi:sigma-B regulation protein RsbU (phosphoserine phosphatase)
MLLLIALPTLVIYVAILGLTMGYIYKESKASAEQNMTTLASSYAARFDGSLREAAQIAETTASLFETSGNLADEQIYQQLGRNVMGSPLVYGACAAFEPGTLKPPGQLFAPYVCRDGDGLRRVNIDETVYDWYRDPRYTWYSLPKKLGKSTWSDPYFDEGAGNILMSTYSAVFKRGIGFGGVVTVDIDLPRLRSTVGYGLPQNVDFVVLTSGGQFVYDADSARIMTSTIFDIAQQNKQPQLAELGKRMLSGKSGTATIAGWDTAQRQWVFYAPIRSAGWVLVCRLPESVVMREVRQRTLWSGGALLLTLGLITSLIFAASKMISSPITRLTDKVLQVAGGQFNVRIDESSRTREIQTLAASFNQMTSDLRSHIERLAAETAARQKIEHDLDIAREIQRSLLPATKPSLPGYEIAGWSRPADRTGGDYYDWQTRESDGRTLVSLADVTGHGVGPALVTAVCRAYARASFGTGHGLSEVMAQLNNLLLADLPEGRYVTYVGVIIDAAQHDVKFVSAGHGPIMHYQRATRSLVEFEATDFPFGVTPNPEYPPTTVALATGDLLILITDGFFEWFGPDGEQFGLARLREAILELADAPIDVLAQRIYEKVRDFTRNAAQDDDMTAVVLRRLA